jgi:hypothetical protein
MSSTSIRLLPPSGNPVIDLVTNGSHWILDGSRTVTWATSDFFVDGWTDPISGAVLIQKALSKFEEVANIRFRYVGHYNSPEFAPADIVFSGTSFPVVFGIGPQTLAWAYFPNEPLSDGLIARRFGNSNTYPNAAGDVWINMASEAIFYPSYPGSDGFFLLLHEIGHALGLKHPHDDGGTGRPTAAAFGVSEADIQLLTVMSYNEGSPIASWFAGNPGSMMPFDILALQWLYGANNSTRAGSDTYRVEDDGVLESLWDAGGVDLVTAAASRKAWTIDLGIVEDAGHIVGFAVPFNSGVTLKYLFDAESAIGSAFADVISGNALANALIGLAGDDSLDGDAGNDRLFGGPGSDLVLGGLGVDVAVYAGSRSNFSISKVAAGYAVSGVEGFDALSDVERLEFSDKKVAIDLAPSQAATNTVKIIGAAFGASAIAQHPEWVGAGLSLFDNESSTQSVCAMVASMMGLSNAAFVNTVFRTVVGRAPSTSEQALYVGLLQGPGASMSQAQLLELAAASDLNAQAINLVGLQQSGIEYL